MIVHWSEYSSKPSATPGSCGLHGETVDGHRFHICASEPAEGRSDQVELWVEAEGNLDYVGHFPSETAAKTHAERLATAA